MFGRAARALLAVALMSAAAPAAWSAPKALRIGFQKNGTLALLKARGGLDERLKPLGYSVGWVEFPGGPQLLEAMNAGAIDFGETGEAPPIFAQAAGTGVTYVASEPPAPLEEAILVPKGSAIASLADLKGKRVALNKGSNVHYLLVRALEKAGVAYADIKPVFLPPADGRAAFESGAVDAWAIWDPYFAAAQAATGARTLATGEDLVPNVEFYLAARDLATKDVPAVDAIVAALDDTDRWAGAHVDETATLAGSLHLPAAVLQTALGRRQFGVARVGPAIMAGQQKIADAIATLGLLPKPVSVADAIVGHEP